MAQAYVDANCTGAPLPFHLVAADGLTMAAATKTQVAVFQPGYRWDALTVFPEDGDYCILNEVSTAAASVNQNFRPTQLLADDWQKFDYSLSLCSRDERRSILRRPVCKRNCSSSVSTSGYGCRQPFPPNYLR
jgi:hypothetical protein